MRICNARETSHAPTRCTGKSLFCRDRISCRPLLAPGREREEGFGGRNPTPNSPVSESPKKRREPESGFDISGSERMERRESERHGRGGRDGGSGGLRKQRSSEGVEVEEEVCVRQGGLAIWVWEEERERETPSA